MDILTFLKIFSRKGPCLDISIKLPKRYITWDFLVDEQDLEETENLVEHPWNLVAASAQLKTSSVPDKWA